MTEDEWVDATLAKLPPLSEGARKGLEALLAVSVPAEPTAAVVTMNEWIEHELAQIPPMSAERSKRLFDDLAQLDHDVLASRASRIITTAWAQLKLERDVDDRVRSALVRAKALRLVPLGDRTLRDEVRRQQAEHEAWWQGVLDAREARQAPPPAGEG